MGLEEIPSSYIKSYPQDAATLLRNTLWYEHDGKLIIPDPVVTAHIDVPSATYSWIDRARGTAPLKEIIPLNGVIIPIFRKEKRFFKSIDTISIRDEKNHDKEIVMKPISLVYGNVHALSNPGSYENRYLRSLVKEDFYLKNLLRIGQKDFAEHGFYTLLRLT